MQIYAPECHSSEVCNSEKMLYHSVLKQTNRGFPEPMAKPCYHRKLHQYIRGVYYSFILIWLISINIYKSGSRDQDINSNGLYKGRILVTLRHILGSSVLHLIKIVLFHDVSTLINARRIVQAGLWAGFGTSPTILTVVEVYGWKPKQSLKIMLFSQIRVSE